MLMAKESLNVVFELGEKGSPILWHLSGMLGGEQQEYLLQPIRLLCPGAVPRAAPQSSPPSHGCILVAALCSTSSLLFAKCLSPLLTIPRG